MRRWCCTRNSQAARLVLVQPEASGDVTHHARAAAGVVVAVSLADVVEHHAEDAGARAAAARASPRVSCGSVSRELALRAGARARARRSASDGRPCRCGRGRGRSGSRCCANSGNDRPSARRACASRAGVSYDVAAGRAGCRRNGADTAGVSRAAASSGRFSRMSSRVPGDEARAVALRLGEHLDQRRAARPRRPRARDRERAPLDAHAVPDARARDGAV